MRPVCVKCRCEMRPEKNDFIVEEMADTEQPYRVWSTDKWRCPSCLTEIVIGFAKEPWSEHYKPDYPKIAEQALLRYWPRPEMVPEGLRVTDASVTHLRKALENLTRTVESRFEGLEIVALVPQDLARDVREAKLALGVAL